MLIARAGPEREREREDCCKTMTLISKLATGELRGNLARVGRKHELQLGRKSMQLIDFRSPPALLVTATRVAKGDGELAAPRISLAAR